MRYDAEPAYVLHTRPWRESSLLVEVLSQAGGPLKLANPWGGEVTVYRGGSKAQDLSGQVLSVATAKGERLTIAPKAQPPVAVRMQQ